MTALLPPPASAPGAAAPLVLGRYQREEALGGGGTASVFAAIDTRNGARVAVKQLRPQFSRLPAARQRFLREAEVVARLDHPGIVKVLDAGVAGDDAYLVLELVEGETLRQLLTRLGALGPVAARRIGAQLAELLGHAHARGIIHRDVKPENVFITGPRFLRAGDVALDDGLESRVRLADFGQARVTALASLTGASLAWGTPEYVAPEIFASGRIDPRSDLYSLGVIVYEIGNGRLPWSRAEALARLGPAGKSRRGPPAEGLAGVLEALLAHKPHNRPESAEIAALALRNGALPWRPPAPHACSACGSAMDPALPMCLECGHEVARFGHTDEGRWRLVLEDLPDDAAVIERLMERLAMVAMPPSKPIDFLTGNINAYSKEEREAAIPLPAVLFADLDAETAQGLAQHFATAGLRVTAVHGRSDAAVLPPRALNWTPTGIVGVFLIALAAQLSDGNFLVIGATATGLVGAVVGARKAWRRWHVTRSSGLFGLSGRPASIARADAIITALGPVVRGLRSPETRALAGELTGALYKLGRRAGEHSWAAGHDQGAVMESLPSLAAHIGQLAQALDGFDDALGRSSEAELMQALGRLERQGSSSDPTLADTRARIEKNLRDRQALQHQRDDAAAALCGLLANLRDAIRATEANDGGHALAVALGTLKVASSRPAALASADPSAFSGNRPAPTGV